MKRLSFLLSQADYEALTQQVSGQKITVRLFNELSGKTIRRRLEVAKPKRKQPPRYKRILCHTPGGWLAETKQRYRLSLSVPKGLGDQRCGTQLLIETEEAVEVFEDMSNLKMKKNDKN